MFVCSTSDTDHTSAAAKPARQPDLRTELIGIWNMVQLAKMRVTHNRRYRDFDVLMHYGTGKIWSRKRRTSVNVPKMIEDWKAVVVVLATAHDKDAIDAAEFKMDELLTPLLGAPIAELRAFYEGLTTALREDKSIPFFLWSTFNAWGKGVLDKCEAKPELKQLRKRRANEIAEMVDEDIKPDITKAVAGALMWRDPESLKEIRADLKAGAKPRLQGKESCLFLTTKVRGKPEHRVML